MKREKSLIQEKYGGFLSIKGRKNWFWRNPD